jgi:hypothetical protein
LARSVRSLVQLALVAALLLAHSSLLRADGGVLRLRQKAGGYQIAVFTLPTPFRAGPVDVSVLVQDAATGECAPEAQVSVCLKAPETERILEYPATTEAATNRLFHAAVFELPEPGWWDVEVTVEGPHGPALLRFGVEADEPTPRWLELWPWFSWPALVVALFGVHRVLVQRKAPPGSTRAGTVQVTDADFERAAKPDAGAVQKSVQHDAAPVRPDSRGMKKSPDGSGPSADWCG